MKRNTYLLLLLFLPIFLSTLIYASFSSELMINGIAYLRTPSDIRITNLDITEQTNQAYELYRTEYNIERIWGKIALPNKNSTITFKVSVTNFSDIEWGILDIIGLQSNLKYTISDYNIKDKLCVESKCTSNVTKEILITIGYSENGYDSASIEHFINLEFLFREVYNLTLINFENTNYDPVILKDENLNVELGIYNNLNLYISMNDILTKDYYYDSNSGILSLNSVTGDVIVFNGTKSYDYTGDIQTFIVPFNGVYKLEVWGAQGGVSNATSSADTTPLPGNGGYSTGSVVLKKGDVLYIGVGGSGANSGYNGGGYGDPFLDKELMNSSASGGGATHIALNKNRGLLANYASYISDILIVAGGGGGSERSLGGSGGGYLGNSGSSLVSTYPIIGTGGTQTNGGVGGETTNYAPTENYSGSFGTGGSGASSDAGAGGGGGFYGGGATTYAGGGGGGSGYIGTAKLIDKHMTCYNCLTNDEYHLKTITTTNQSIDSISDYSKQGNGSAKITLVSGINETVLVTINANGGTYESESSTSFYVAANSSIDLQIPTKNNYVFTDWSISGEEYSLKNNTLTVGNSDITLTANYISPTVASYDYSATIKEFVVEYSGIYKLEVWGAQGGVSSGALASSTLSYGGYGGYSVGNVNLKKGDKLYVVVGGSGNKDGYNGGGIGDTLYSQAVMETYSYGGGATHIALNSNRGLLSNYESYQSEVLIVAGGGGGAEHHAGGSGGGFTGVAGSTLYDNSYQFFGTGGAQSSGGIGTASPSGAATGNINGSFGLGGSGEATDAGAGGGGGWYGGGATTVAGGAGGGSGYIGNTLLSDKYMTCYNCTTSTATETKTNTTTNTSKIATKDYAKIGNGYAKITFIKRVYE